MPSSSKNLHEPLLDDLHRVDVDEGCALEGREGREEEQFRCLDKKKVLCWILLPVFFMSQIGLVYFLRGKEVMSTLYWSLVYLDVFVFLATAWLYRCSIIMEDGLRGMEIFYLFLPEILTDLTTLLVLFDRYTLAFVSLTASVAVFGVLAVQAVARMCCHSQWDDNDRSEEYDCYESNDDDEEEEELRKPIILII